jgi:3-hydroxyisobutyrate dehydrogenase
MAHTVGFIGLGHMGFPMASNLLRSDLVSKLYVYDLAKEPMQKLVNNGAISAASIKEIAASCDIIFTMLQSGDQVVDVCLADDGIFKNHKPGLIYIDCSSINVTTSRELHLEAESYQIAMLDAPVSGGVKGAEAATLTIMVGGEHSLLELVRPLLNTLGKNVIHAGKAGNGQVAKICNNMILGVSMIAVSEAFNLGKKLGLEPQHLFDIASKGSGQCWSLTSYCPYPDILEQVPSSNEYQPGFTAQMMLKDLRLSQKAANSVDVATPMGALASSLYSLFVNSDTNEDFSAIIKFLDGCNK